MSYHEDRFIEWCGEQDGQLGASPGDAIRRLRRNNNMIPNDQPLRKQTIERMLNHIIDQIEAETFVGTKWEEDFASSVHEQFLHRGDISQKQADILERIYDK